MYLRLACSNPEQLRVIVLSRSQILLQRPPGLLIKECYPGLFGLALVVVVLIGRNQTLDVPDRGTSSSVRGFQVRIIC